MVRLRTRTLLFMSIILLFSVGLLLLFILQSPEVLLLTVHTNGVSSSNPITVTKEGIAVSTTHDGNPLQIFLDKNTATNIGVDGARVWTNSSIRYKFTGWTGNATGTSFSNPIQVTLTADSSCTAYYKTQYLISLNFKDSSGASSLYADPSQVQAMAPNGSLVTFTSYSNLWLDSGTWIIKQVKWQGNNVKPSTDPTYTPAAGGTWTVNCRVYNISFSNAFKDNTGATLYTYPSSFKLTFPNATVSTPLDPSSSYYIQNGTTTWTSITWQETEVTPSTTFDATDGDPSVNCEVYSLNIKNKDHFNNPLTKDVPLTFPNGTALVKTPTSGWINMTQVQTGVVSLGSPITVSATERYVLLNSSGISLASSTTVDAEVWQHDFKVKIGFKDNSGSCVLSPPSNYSVLMQNRTSIYTPPSNAWMPAGTTTLTSITWHGSNVRPQKAPTTSISSATSYHYNVRVYNTTFDSSQFRDSDGTKLYSAPSSFKVIFPNGTTSSSLTLGSYLIQNGTTVWSSITWQGTEVTPSLPFDAKDGSPTVDCKVYSLSFIFKDNSSTTNIHPTQWTIKAPNGTISTALSRNITQAQTGTWELTSITWQGNNIIPTSHPTILLTSNQVWTTRCRVYPITISFKDANGSPLYRDPSRVVILFPNGTDMNVTSYTFLAQNGTSTIKEIIWQSNKIAPSTHPTFDAANGNLSVILTFEIISGPPKISSTISCSVSQPDLNNYLEETDPTEIIDDGGAAFWLPSGEGTGGTIGVPSESDDTGEKAKGSDSYKFIVGADSHKWWRIYHGYGENQDWSAKEFIGFYFYGANTVGTVRLYIQTKDSDFENAYHHDFVDNFTGWKRFVLPMGSFSTYAGSPDWSQVRGIAFDSVTENMGGTWRIDRFVVDVGQWPKVEVFIPNLTIGDSIIVSGSINPAVSDMIVTLTYTKPDSSILNRTVTSLVDGSYSDTYTPDCAGSWSVKASWEGDSIHEGASSSSVSFCVQSVVFDLVVHVVDEKGNDLPNADVTLFWLNGTEITSTSTNSTGHVVFENLPSTAYSIKATLKGYRDQRIEAALTSEDQVETMTLQSTPFIETPMGITIVSGGIITGIIAITLMFLKRRRI